MRHRMTRAGGSRKLWDHVTRVRSVRDIPHREVSEFRGCRFASAGTVAAKAVLVLVLGWRNRSDPIAGQYSIHRRLGHANLWRRGERSDLLSAMRVVTVNARRMAVVIRQNRFSGIVRIAPGRKRMIGSLGKFGVNVEQRGSDIIVAVVAVYATLGISVHVSQCWRGTPQQSCRAICIVLHMATRTRIQGNR
jgi:hypothetical protein